MRLHLGSVRSKSEVPGEWQRLLRRHPDLERMTLLPPQQVAVAGKGTFFRVLASGSPDAAQRACDDLRAAGDACRVLMP